MKSRLIRALAIGAALAVPIGGGAVFGSGVAGANSKLLQTGSILTFGGISSVTLAGITLNYTGLNSPTNRPVSLSPTLKANITATDATAGAKILSGAKITFTGTGSTADKSGCVITINKRITLTFTSPSQLNGSVTPTAAQLTVTGCAGGITSTIKAEIVGKAISIKLI